MKRIIKIFILIILLLIVGCGKKVTLEEARQALHIGIKVYSPKYIKSQGLDNREVREYNSITDVKFDWEMW